MKNWLLTFGFCFLALVLQSTLLPSLFTSIGSFIHWNALIHLTINVVLLILMYICFSRDFFSAFFWMIAIILMQNAFDVPWKGSLALSYFFLMIIIYVMETMFVFQYSISSMLIIFALIFLQNIFHLLLGGISMGFEYPFYGEIFRMFINSFISTLAVPFVFAVLYYIDSRTIFHFDKSKSFFGRRVGL